MRNCFGEGRFLGGGREGEDEVVCAGTGRGRRRPQAMDVVVVIVVVDVEEVEDAGGEDEEHGRRTRNLE